MQYERAYLEVHMRQRGKIIYTNDRLFKVSQLTAMRSIEKAWKSKQTIENCWRATLSRQEDDQGNKEIQELSECRAAHSQ